MLLGVIRAAFKQDGSDPSNTAVRRNFFLIPIAMALAPLPAWEVDAMRNSDPLSDYMFNIETATDFTNEVFTSILADLAGESFPNRVAAT